MIKRILKIIIWIVVLVIGIFLILLGVVNIFSRPREDIQWGVTFSSLAVEEYGLDSRDALIAVLDELGVVHIRLPVYWNRLEKEKDKFDFNEVDWQLEQIALREADVILAVGQKLPRWPECHIPGWVQNLSPQQRKREILDMIQEVVRRYTGYGRIVAWQVENEPLFSFGKCPRPDKKLLEEEIALVRSIDRRPILLTDSGELGRWLPTARRADVFGTTLYHQVWNTATRVFRYHLPASFFKMRRWLLDAVYPGKPAIIVEYQMEPWGKELLPYLPLEEQFRIMQPEEFDARIDFARRTGFDIIYLWGVEWWYWLHKVNKIDSAWNQARSLFSVDLTTLNFPFP